MPTAVAPAEFSMVFFDASEIAAIADRLAARVGLPADLAVELVVDETTPLGRARVASVDPVRLELESGALEDAKRPRHLSPRGAADVLGRLLYEVHDRLDPAFGEPPADDDLTLAQASAWVTYCVGRLEHLGEPVQRQRRLYHFRNRHGFTDAADAAFEQLWDGRGLTWSDVDRISTHARAVLQET